MRAAARRIIDQFGPETARHAAPTLADQEVDKVNALERPYDPVTEQVPASWTPEHAGKRIVEAFATLSKLPPDRGPREPGNNWMPYVYDRADLNAQATLDDAQEKDERRRARNRVLSRPTAIELRRMETVFEWLRELHGVDDGLCRVVQRWARLRASGRSIKEWCRSTGLSFQIFYRQRDKAMGIIVTRIGATSVW